MTPKENAMKIIRLLLLFLLLAAPARLSAQNQGTVAKPNESPEELAAKTADQLMTYLGLDDRQVYQVDSTLQSVYTQLFAQIEAVRKSGATNDESYLLVSDRWGAVIDSTFRCIFNDRQWKLYLKTPSGKEKKARDKRMARRAR